MQGKKLLLLATMVGALTTSAAWAAGEFGTADEAKAMLNKAAAAVKADKAAALAQFAKGEGGFKDRDLYPFCGGPDGTFTAHPTLTGKSLKDLKDKSGKALGEEIYSTAKEGDDQGSQLHVAAPGPDRSGAEGHLRHQDRRPDLRRRLLQVRFPPRSAAAAVRKPAAVAFAGRHGCRYSIRIFAARITSAHSGFSSRIF